ncbi:AraC family transcriptional regulator, partial [Burkholderia cenocepacia]|nr:AraC family transcriptional regulator [Burkholderia cenocepacia]
AHGAASPDPDERLAAACCDGDGADCDACVAARGKTGGIPVKSTDRDLDSRFPCPSSPLPPPPLSARRK